VALLTLFAAAMMEAIRDIYGALSKSGGCLMTTDLAGRERELEKTMPTFCRKCIGIICRRIQCQKCLYTSESPKRGHFEKFDEIGNRTARTQAQQLNLPEKISNYSSSDKPTLLSRSKRNPS
jgi:hypothetical protein